MKEDKHTKSVANNQVCAIFQIRDIRKNVLPRLIKLCIYMEAHCRSMGRSPDGGGGLGPPNNFDRHVSFSQRPRSSRCSSVQVFISVRWSVKKFIYGFNKETLLKINALRRLKCYFGDPIVQNPPGYMPPHPPRGLRLRRSWLALAVNLTLFVSQTFQGHKHGRRKLNNRNVCFWVFLLMREFFAWGTHKY